MKNFVKWFGLIALVAIIGFSFAACDDDSDGSSGVSNSGSGTWTVVSNSTFGTDKINAIAFANNTFVAGGSRGRIAYSK